MKDLPPLITGTLAHIIQHYAPHMAACAPPPPHVPRPERDIRVLLGFLTNTSPDFYFMYPQTFISEEIMERLHHLIQRLCQGEPLSKIIQKREFYGRIFKVTHDTLDPRPDTETLIDGLLRHHKTLPHPLRILDLGTGTGCILLTLLAELSYATGVGIDCCDKALTVAHENARRLGLQERAHFYNSHWFEGVTEKFSVILSNPPYIKTDETLEAAVYDYDPHGALFAGVTGLDAYTLIAQKGKEHLLPGGMILLEHGKDQQDAIIDLFQRHHFQHRQSLRDLSGIQRCLIFA